MLHELWVVALWQNVVHLGMQTSIADCKGGQNWIKDLASYIYFYISNCEVHKQLPIIASCTNR